MHSQSNKKLSLIKCLFILFNGIWFLLGLALVVMGTILKVNYKLIIGDGMEMVIKELPNSMVIIFMSVGAVIVMVFMIANCAAIVNDYRLLYFFGVINVLLILVQLIAITLAARFSNELADIGDKRITYAIKHYKVMDTYQEVNQMSDIDHLQYVLRCCGSHKPEDWQLNERFNQTPIKYPFSCCHDLKPTLSDCNSRRVSQTPGCVEAITNRYSYRVLSLIVISILSIIIQIILIVIAYRLGKGFYNYETI
ncbi:tetraspanin-19-like [Oppia nitens]|uniref:tetraspanin-19-like n=1 Tax=Oppia nitens TaxID=1686743 RepID=UPI0023DB217A|nr:tetraspanin-19-like [Oppia nitens]